MIKLVRRSFVGALIALATCATFGLSAHAQGTYPDRPIKLLVGYQPGGGADLTARIIAPKLSEMFKVPVVVENRAGASGMIAEGALAKAPPDGYTLLVDPIGIVMNPSLFRKISYDPINEILPVAQLVTLNFVIVTNPSVPARTISELVEVMRTRPKQINVATAGASTQLTAELFRLTTNVELTFVPYKGSAPASTAVIAGETQVMFSDMPSVAQHISNGRLRAIAVTGSKRAAALPEVPTAKEGGLSNFEVASWFGLFAPAGTPSEIVNKLNAAANEIVMMPDVVPRFERLGAEPSQLSAQEFARIYRSELERWRDVVSRARIPLND
jgi:tripartite-type tricarboxylate transporter receptor subunit TctC